MPHERKISCDDPCNTPGGAKLHRTTIGTHVVSPDRPARPCRRACALLPPRRRPAGGGRALHLAGLLVLPAGQRLSERTRRDRSDVLPLAFHVTYWDRLGWKDPFSMEAATERQDRYGHRFGDGSYTPEIVVDGASSHVGSDRGEVGPAIEQAKRKSRDGGGVSVAESGDSLMIEVGGGNGSGKVLLVGFDHDHQTAIRRGENGGRTLQESNVVRSIRAIGDWQGNARFASARNFPKAKTSPSSSRHPTDASSARRSRSAASRGMDRARRYRHHSRR